VLIAVIGKRWLISSEAEGSRRLDNPDDFVRLEIATALKRNIRVIPVLVDDASMPRVNDLPDDLKSLIRRQAIPISHDRFNADSDRLIAALDRVFEKTAAEQREREEKARLEAERREREEKEQLELERREVEKNARLEAERRQREQQDRLEAEQREKERLEAEQRERERQEAERRHEETLTAPAQPEADKPSADTPKVFHPLPPKPAESGHEKSLSPSLADTGGKGPSKQVVTPKSVPLG